MKNIDGHEDVSLGNVKVQLLDTVQDSSLLRSMISKAVFCEFSAEARIKRTIHGPDCATWISVKNIKGVDEDQSFDAHSLHCLKCNTTIEKQVRDHPLPGEPESKLYFCYKCENITEVDH
ncbi:unnamed protein product [Adineta steineri]|uniref:Uncharacterized protein n=1 Tax=Adineta steineri TaxID=433720 RepID=A0A814ERJ6_9BILA|nr:unnamed protein product [Adineta steineri]CAF1649061.1 unnamed protein product [Adineta steineri]